MSKKITYVNKQLIDAIKQYDIIYVKMSAIRIKEQGIIKHTKRPFIVEEVTDNRIKGYYLTGSIDNYSKKKSNKFILNHENYDLDKDSLVRCENIEKLPHQNILGIIDHLNDFDIAMLKKYRAFVKGRSFNSNKENPVLEVGDMILYNNKSYVILKKNNDLIAYNFHCNENNSSNLTFEFAGQKYTLDYKEMIHLNKDSETTIFNRLNDYSIEKLNKEIDKINKNYKLVDMNHNKLDYETVELGDIIFIGDKNYLIYQMDSTMIYGYSINQTKEKIRFGNGDRNPEIVFIDGRNYYLDFEDNIQLKKKGEYDIIARLGDKAAKEAIDAKKLYKYINKCLKKNKKRPKC